MPDIFYVAIDLFWDCVGYSNSQKNGLIACIVANCARYAGAVRSTEARSSG